MISEYIEHDVPLDVFVIDMDWHLTFYKKHTPDQGGQAMGSTGFTFNKHLFADHEKFLQWCKQLSLKNTFNLHPASGIQPWEEKYVEMARAMNIDPSTRHYVAFNVTDRKFVSAWFDIVLNPLQDSGVEFWWLDWQQVGFSGDVVPNWDSLSFQPHFTSTAANVGYGYWSHDLGGYKSQPDPQLYIRWIQWATFSPTFRTHAGKSRVNDRRTYDRGLSIALPLYYFYPEYNESYTYSNEYLFGEYMFVSAITEPINNDTGLVNNWPVWFPPDCEWINFFTGDLSSNLTKSYSLDEMAVYVKIGSIIPLLPEPQVIRGRIARAQQIPSNLLLYCLIGGSSQGNDYLYEDDGVTTDYQQSSSSTSAITLFNYTVSNNILQLNISAASGSFSSFPKSRSYEIHLRSVFPATNILINNVSISVEPFNELINGQDKTTNGYTYDGSTLSVIIYLRQSLPTSQSIQIEIQLSESITYPLLLQRSISFVGLLGRLQTVKALLDNQGGSHSVYMDDYPLLLDAASSALRITHSPSTAKDEVDTFFNQRLPGACDEVQHKITNLDRQVRTFILAQLECQTFLSI